MFLGYANTVITYFYQYMLAICSINAGQNMTSLLAILGRVAYNIDNNLPEFLLVSMHTNGLFATFFDAASYVLTCRFY